MPRTTCFSLAANIYTYVYLSICDRTLMHIYNNNLHATCKQHEQLNLLYLNPFRWALPLCVQFFFSARLHEGIS